MSNFKLHPKMRLGAPALIVRDLDGSLSYYEKDLGLSVLGRAENEAGHKVIELSTSNVGSEPLLILDHDPSAKESPPNSAGLYHYAILVPDRKSLALTYLALGKRGVYFEGFADHLVSESLYLRDPEGNGIEIYRDRPREEWKRDQDGHIMMDTLPLNIPSLLSELNSEERKNAKAFPDGAKIGHMHLKVTNLERSKKFYSESLGLDITSDWSSVGALFLSVGGYHHHIGMNVWESRGGAYRVNQDAGLDHFTLIVPDRAALEDLALQLNLEARKGELSLSDPDGIKIRVKHD